MERINEIHGMPFVCLLCSSLCSISASVGEVLPKPTAKGRSGTNAGGRNRSSRCLFCVQEGELSCFHFFPGVYQSRK